MGAELQIVIRCTSELWQALRWGSDVALQLPFVDARLQTSTERRFNFWRKVCGCQVGALTLLATLGYRIPVILRTPEWTWSALAMEAGIALLAALAGKALAMLGARFLLAVDIALLLRRARQSQPNIGEG
jgi:hypothetical protein